MSTGIGSVDQVWGQVPVVPQAVQAPAYGGFASYQAPPTEIPDYRDKFISILGKYYNQVQLTPFIPDVYSVAYTQSALVRSHGYRVFDQMRLDDMVAAGIMSWIGNALPDARFAPPDLDDPEDGRMAKSIADFYKEQFKRIPGGFLASLSNAIEYLVTFGFNLATLPLGIEDQGKWRGFTKTVNIQPLEPHFLIPSHDGNGRPCKWYQIDRQAGTSVEFDQSEILHLVIGSNKDQARGRSLLLPAHIHWITKTMLLRLRNHNAEWAVGRIFFQHDKNETENGLTAQQYQAFCSEWINHYIDRWGIPLPYGVSATLQQSSTITPDVYNAVLRHADQGILRSIQIDWMLQEEPEFGNRALGDVKEGQSSNKFKIVQSYIAAQCQEALVDRTAKINGWPRKLWPEFTMQPAVEKNKIEVVGKAAEIQGQQLISKQPQDENWYRERLGMPLVKETDVQAAQAQTIGAPAGEAGESQGDDQGTPDAPQVPGGDAEGGGEPEQVADNSEKGDIYRELKEHHPDWEEDQLTAVMLEKARRAEEMVAEKFSALDGSLESTMEAVGCLFKAAKIKAEIKEHFGDQPRVPAGVPTGGQFASKSGGHFPSGYSYSGSTYQKYRKGHGAWDSDRVKMVHDPYVKAVSEGVPTGNSPVVYMTGGGPAAGKSTGILNNPEAGIPDKTQAERFAQARVPAGSPEGGQFAGDKEGHTLRAHLAKLEQFKKGSDIKRLYLLSPDEQKDYDAGVNKDALHAKAVSRLKDQIEEAEYSYHGTPAELESIRQHGIKPGNLSKEEYIEKWGGTSGSGRNHVYLASFEGGASTYGAHLLRVNRRNLPKDTKVSQGGRIFRTSSTIAPEHIEVKTDKGWEKLVDRHSEVFTDAINKFSDPNITKADGNPWDTYDEAMRAAKAADNEYDKLYAMTDAIELLSPESLAGYKEAKRSTSELLERARAGKIGTPAGMAAWNAALAAQTKVEGFIREARAIRSAKLKELTSLSDRAMAAAEKMAVEK